MVLPHAAVARPAKRHAGVAQMNDAVVDAAPAKPNALGKKLGRGARLGVHV